MPAKSRNLKHKRSKRRRSRSKSRSRKHHGGGQISYKGGANEDLKNKIEQLAAELRNVNCPSQSQFGGLGSYTTPLYFGGKSHKKIHFGGKHLLNHIKQKGL